MMKFLILTLFPEMFSGVFAESIIGRAQREKKVDIELMNIREFGKGKQKQVDDTPYGGGAGMVFRPDVLAAALRAAKKKLPAGKIIFLTPHGAPLNQEKAERFAASETPLILLCGHYEGIDQRIREMFIDEEISLGEFVLTGGEIPAMALTDAVVRLLPGVLGNEGSAHEESFSQAFAGRYEYPHYTRPENFEGMQVPPVLLSGHHAKIESWRMEHLEGFTPEEREIFDVRKDLFSPRKPWKSKRLLYRMPIATDIDYWRQWRNDPEVHEYLCIAESYTHQDAADEYQEKIKDLNTLSLTLLEREEKMPIGAASIMREDLHQKSGKLELYIGEKELWGKGYGKEATTELINIAFRLLHLKRLTLEVFQENLVAVEMYKRCGFRIVGALKEAVEKEGKVKDLFVMELLRAEWESQGKEDATERKLQEFRGGFSV